jgi:putative PEP-CTERM system histidine kinase
MWNNGVNFLNYAAGAIAFFILSWQLASPRFRPYYPLTLAIAAIVTSLRMVVVIAQGNLDLSPLVLFGFDLLFYAFWYWAIFGMVYKLTGAHLPKWMSTLCLVLILAIAGLAVIVSIANQALTTIYASTMITWSNLLLAVLGVVLLEQLYRNVSTTNRHAIKFFSLGLAALFIYELYLFSQILVFQTTPSASWNARGAIYSIVCVFLIITLSKPDDAPQVSLSRNMVFYTTGLLGAGVLLFLMSAVGYYIKIYGQHWGAAFQQVLTFTGIVGLVIISTVPSLRASALVFINKHFFSHKYDYRTEWLKLIDMLSRPPEDGNLQQHAIKSMISIFHSPGGILWLRNGARFEPVAAYPIPLPENTTEPADSAFISVLKEKEWIFDAKDGRFPEDRSLPPWADSIDNLWIIVPLLNEENLLGFIGLLRDSHAGNLTWEDLDLLKTVGRQMANFLARHQAGELLAQSRQFDAYNKLTAFIVHDLKNLIAQQALVVENAAKHKENPAFVEDMINTVENSVNRMNNLLSKMQRKEPSPAKAMDLEQALIEVVKKCSDVRPTPTLRLEQRGLKAKADRDNLIMIMSHLIRNAQDATDENGFIDIRLARSGDRAILEVEDNGDGMSEEFVKERLFKPFDTTKSGRGMGIGVYQAKEYVRAIGGDIKVVSEQGIGTTFRITIPLVAPKQEAA